MQTAVSEAAGRTLKVNDFFCGCGGIGVAFMRAGYEVAGAWDIDRYAVRTYRENVGAYVKQRDIKEMTYRDIPKADVWAFGFPCQDLSVAGRHGGNSLDKAGNGIKVCGLWPGTGDWQGGIYA